MARSGSEIKQSPIEQNFLFVYFCLSNSSPESPNAAPLLRQNLLNRLGKIDLNEEILYFLIVVIYKFIY